MSSSVTSTISPTGGAISLIIKLDPSLDPYTTTMTIQRYSGSLSSTPTTIYSGVASLIYLDVNDDQPSFLSFTTPYWYKVNIITSGESITVGPITPSAELIVFSNYLDKVLFRLFSAGMTALAVPQGFNAIRVLENMPLSMASEATKFPFVVMNLDLEQQQEIQIGESVTDTNYTNTQVMPLLVYRMYSMSILSQNARERDFYKDAVIATWMTMRPILNQIGQDIYQDWQATNTQVTEDLKIPGFYQSVVMLEMTGQFNVSIQTQYPIISSISGTVSGYTATRTGGLTIFQW